MATQAKELWSLVLDRQQIDPEGLASAIEEGAAEEELDYRTRLLIRDSVEALKGRWGAGRVAIWLAACPAREIIEPILREKFDRPGFPFLAEQIMETTRPETIKHFLRELGDQLRSRTRIDVGGSVALILPGYLTRRTQDLDVVNEVPSEIRSQGKFLNELMQRYQLQLAHFQSHYLPQGWEQRTHSLGTFGRLEVHLVDVYDVFLSKLFSAREKDRDDLRALLPHLSKDAMIARLLETCKPLLRETAFREQATKNWYILFGEPLPSWTEPTEL